MSILDTVLTREELDEQNEIYENVKSVERATTDISGSRGPGSSGKKRSYKTVTETGPNPEYTFTASDVRIMLLTGTGTNPVVDELAHCTRFYYTSYRATPTARPLGHVNVDGIARGTRTIAGDLDNVLTSKDKLYTLIKVLDRVNLSADEGNGELQYFTLDQLPPVDILITFNNEYGSSCFKLLHGVIFTTENITMESISSHHHKDTQLSIIPNLNFIALDSTPIIPMNDTDIESATSQKLLKQTINSEAFSRVTGKTGATTYDDIFGKEYDKIYKNSRRNTI